MAAAPRIGILVVAYNAASTLRSVLERIDPHFRPRIAAVLVSDDHSSDDTYAVGVEVQQEMAGLPMTVVRQPRNLGYGGNQKFGYRWAVDHDLDIVVMLHGDGQYAPELLAEVVAPIERGDADVVLGSRMLHAGGARRGGMPLYKLVGNRVLTRMQNAVTGLALSEWHSGYRAFSVPALAGIPFEQNSDGFDFDTEVLLQLHDREARIVEVPIPTFYGDEICYVNGVAYARDVMVDVMRYRLQRLGFGDDSLAVVADDDRWSVVDEGSGNRLAAWVGRPGQRVLALGCEDRSLVAELQAAGHEVVAVGSGGDAELKECVDRFVVGDLEDGLPPGIGEPSGFDVVLAADVIEHVRDPELLLAGLHDVLAPGGRLLLAAPNFGHWYVRLRVGTGRFDYDRRGVLDRRHVRFFTRRSLERLLHRTGWHVVRSDVTGLPFGIVDRGGRAGLAGRLRRTFGAIDRALSRRRPTLFGYELLYELEPSLGRI